MASPMYRQIAEDLRAQIETGTLEPGQQLRTETELGKRYGASRNTVRDAMKWLITLGVVETRPGQGTFVVKKPKPFVTTLTADPKIGPGGDEVANYGSDVEAQRRIPFNSEPQVETQKASATIAAELRVAEGSHVISRHVKRYIDDTPWSLQTSFYPMGFALKGADQLLLAEDIKIGAVKYLGETLGLQQVGYRDWITVRAPDAIEAVFFNLPQDGRIVVFENFRTGFDQTGTPMRVTVTIFPTDRNQFKVNVGNLPPEDISTE